MNLEINNEKNPKPNSSNFSKELENYINKSPITFSIDRFEDDFAICEDKQTHEMVNIKRDLLPNNCKEGDIIQFVNGTYSLDKEQTQKEQKEIKNLVDSLFKKKN